LNTRVSILLLAMMILASAHGVGSAFSSAVYVTQAKIDRVDYPRYVVVGEHFEMTVAWSYGYFEVGPEQESVGYRVLGPPDFSNQLCMGSVTKWAEKPTVYSGTQVGTCDEYQLDQVGLNAIRVVTYTQTLDQFFRDDEYTTLNHQDIQIEGVKPFSLQIQDVQYVKPPDTIAVGETTPVVVKIKYGDPFSISEPMSFVLAIYDLDTGSSVGAVIRPSQKFSGAGTYTFAPLNIIVRSTQTAGDWELRVEVSAELGEEVFAEAKKAITIKVESAQVQEVQITRIVTPPGTLAIGESAPVTVSVQCSGLPSGTKLMLWFKDQDTGTQLTGSATSSLLSGSSTYTFKPLNVKPTRSGDWHLQALVDLNGDTVATKAFTIKVVGAGAPLEAEIRITSVKQPPGTLRVGESAPITVKISYENLAPGTKLTVIVHDNDAHKDLGSVTSIALSGTGTYTFPNITIRPTREGSWHLGVMISGHSETRTNITIKVVK